MEILPITAAGVTLITEGRPPRYIAASNPAALRFEKLQSEVGEGPCLLAYRTGSAVTVPDIAVETRFPRFAPAARHAGMAAVFTFPLRHGHGLIGALDLYRDTTGPLGAHDLRAAQTLADVTAAYLANAESREQAQHASDLFLHKSLHDPLTGLPNRELLHDRLTHADQRAQRSRGGAAVLFVDLDEFKRVNDHHGHHVGDTLLVAVARRLIGLIRPGDTLARVSGDEFVLLCEDLDDQSHADDIASRITTAFAAPFTIAVDAAADVAVAVTASVGLRYAHPGETISKRLVMDADHAMYQAKDRSRRHMPSMVERDDRPQGVDVSTPPAHLSREAPEQHGNGP